MAKHEHINELFKVPKTKFLNHLKLPYNSRIIFSGIFGIGKSHFLNRFFSLDEIRDKYEVIRLAPINYTISSNEDILKYIKYDLLVELLSKNIDINRLDLNFSHYLSLYLNENWKHLCAEALKIAGSVAKFKVGNVEVFEQIVRFFNKLPNLNKFQQEKQSKYNEEKIFNDFMSEVEQSSHLYDETIITQIIERKIQSLKVTKDNQTKETVLIIDDLDRIDPEHIFRILNVFGAHFENGQFESFSSYTCNKFNFDKVILVCDINNIRNIFHSKYGTATDFAGYIDKFYTHEIFEYDIRYLISKIVFKITSQFQFRSHELQRKLSDNDEQLLHYLIKAMFNKNLINLRSFLKFYQHQEQIHFEDVDVHGMTLNPTFHPVLWQLSLLKQIVGDRKSFKKALSYLKLKDIVDNRFDTESVVSQLLYCLTISDHHFMNRENLTYDLDNKVSFLFDCIKDDLRVKKLKYLSQDPTGNDQGDPRYEDIEYGKHLMSLLDHLVDWMIDARLM